MTLDLQCEGHSQIITLAPSNPHSLSVWKWVAGGLDLGLGGQGSGSLLCMSSASTPTLGSSLPLPWLQWFYLTASYPS